MLEASTSNTAETSASAIFKGNGENWAVENQLVKAEKGIDQCRGTLTIMEDHRWKGQEDKSRLVDSNFCLVDLTIQIERIIKKKIPQKKKKKKVNLIMVGNWQIDCDGGGTPKPIIFQEAK